jgi:hypothetical protein
VTCTNRRGIDGMTTDSEEDHPSIAAIKAALDRNSRLSRKHADFFQWFDKPSQEAGLAAEFCTQLKRRHGITYSLAASSDLQPDSPLDPPDVVLKDDHGALIGVEITELVNQKAIEAQIQNRPEYIDIAFRFDAAAAVEVLHHIIKRKELAAVNVCRYYADYLLLVHTAEPWLPQDELATAVSQHTWPATRGIHAAYVMCDYLPSDPYRLVKLF